MPDDLDQFMKSIGAPNHLQAGGSGVDQRASSPSSEGGLTGALHTISEYTDPTPAMKSAAGAVANIAELVPGVKGSAATEAAHRWADEGQDTDSTFKRSVGEVLPFMFGGELPSLAGRVGPLARQLATRVAPQTVRGAAGRFTRNPSQLAQLAHAIATKAPAATRIAERGAAGAALGAAESPEDRTRGATLGGAGALAPSVLGALARSAMGQRGLTHLATHAGLGPMNWLASTMLGPAAWAAYPFMGWNPWTGYGPLGRILHKGAHWLVDRSGQLIAKVPPEVSRITSAEGARGASAAFAPGQATQAGEDTDNADQEANR